MRSNSSNFFYVIEYDDVSFSEGVFAKETLTIATIYILTSCVGCGQNNIGVSSFASLLGLGHSQLSFQNKLLKDITTNSGVFQIIFAIISHLPLI